MSIPEREFQQWEHAAEQPRRPAGRRWRMPRRRPRLNVIVQGGTLSARGRVEYGPTIKLVDLEQAVIKNVRVDYVHTRKDAGITQKAALKTERATREAAKART